MRTLRSSAMALAALAICAPGAGATVDAGPAVTPRVKIEVTHHARHERVVSGQVQFEMACADSTRIARSVYLPGSKVGRHGGFRLSAMSGGNYGPDGHIAVWVSLAGRLGTAGRATGAFSASALVVEGEWEPAVACGSGRVNWAA